MHSPPDLLVFSDLDGTLLDHETYTWQPARPALEHLRNLGAGLVLASSKTAAEIAPLRAEIGFSDWPAIVENGSGLLPPGQTDPGETATYDKLRAILADLPRGFRGFADMSADDIATVTGLSPKAARQAQDRRFSEPGLWTGSDDGLNVFTQAAQAAGLTLQRGGRFLTLSFGGTKAGRMKELIAAHRPRHTLALGDAPNDADMLQTAEFGVIVANPSAPDPGIDAPHIRKTHHTGPQGWSDAVLDILDALALSRKTNAHG